MKRRRKMLLVATVCLSMGVTLFPMTAFADSIPEEGNAQLQAEEIVQEEPQMEIESIYLEPTEAQVEEVIRQDELQVEEVIRQDELQEEEVIQQNELQEKEVIRQDEPQEEEALRQDKSQEEEALQQDKPQEKEVLQQDEALQEEEALQQDKVQQEEGLQENTIEAVKEEAKNAALLQSVNSKSGNNNFLVQEEEVELVPAGLGRGSGNTSQYGSKYDHVDVKVDAKYNVKVDGVSYSLDGYLQSESIVVTVGNKIYAYNTYRVNQRSENGKYEYDIKVEDLTPSSIAWVDNDFTMSNVNVQARILFAQVPEALQTILSTVEIDGVTYYYSDFNMPYTGVQECTGGRGMRSEGKTGTPTGLDLYITKDAADIIITKGKLGIEKLIVDEEGNAVEDDNTAFTFHIKGNTVEYENVVEVLGGNKNVLENLPAGSYTITEQEMEGYAIYSIDGNETDNYSYNYTVVVKEDGDIPIATFTNTKLSDKSALTLQKVAEGLGEDASYPDPTIRIYAVDEKGNKSEVPVWENTVSANGDTIYLNVYLDTGKYLIEESGESVEDYDCDSMIYLNGEILSGNAFEIVRGGQNLAIDLINTYSKTIIPSEPDPEPDPEPEIIPDPEPEPEPEIIPDPEPEPEPEIIPDPEPEPEPEVKPDPEPKKIPETPVIPKKETKEDPIPAVTMAQTAAVPTLIANKAAVTSTAPKTGEEDVMQIWLVMLVLAGSGLAAASYWDKMKNR